MTDDNEELTDVDLFLMGELEWDQLSKADQRIIRDEMDDDTPYY